MSIKKVLSFLLIFTLCFGVISFATDNYNVKVTEFSYLRDDVSGEISGYVQKNTVKTVYGVKKDSYGVDWYKVYYNGSYRYLNSLSTSKNFDDIQDFNVLTTDLVNVRASAWGEILGFIRKNTVKTVYGIRRDRYGNTWYRIWYNGKAGYIKKDATSKDFSGVEEFVVKTTDLTALRDRTWGDTKGYLKKNTPKSVYGVRKDRFGYTWYRVYKDSKPYFISELTTSKSLNDIEDFNVKTTDLVNVRDKVRGSVRGYIHKNTVKTVYGVSRDKFGNTWYRVWYDSKAGYIKKAATSKNFKTITDYNIVILNKQDVQECPNGDIFGQIDEGAVKTVYGLRVDKSGNTWCRVWFNSKAGYILFEDKYKHNQPLDTPGMVNVEGYIEANTIKNPNILSEVKKETLINKFNWLPEGYQPSKLKQIHSGCERTIYLEAEAADAFEALRRDALKKGIKYVVLSGYRTYDKQKYLYNKAYKENRLYAIKSVAYPGSSEHSSGYAMDISYHFSLPVDYYSTPQGKFLEKNAHKYGFVLRYPKGKQAITNYKYESWHYRYVGVKLAKILKDRGITLEEYYGVDSFK